ncbi:MAG: metallophosphoesterase [Myxococcales bacterium]|nr:metallophosphoesterase [Myxococcales bacterium]
MAGVVTGDGTRSAFPAWWGRKVARLPERGVLLVATDLQGNLGDFRALAALHQRERDAGREAWLLLCGDLVHGPPESLTAEHWPDHLGSFYEDRSAELVLEYMQYVRRFDSVCLLGNHEHAHVGGPVVSKFHIDEASVLEDRLGPDVEPVRAFLSGLPLVAVAPCGIVCTHGAPHATEADLEAFEQLDYGGHEDVPLWRMLESGTVGALLWARGASEVQASALLEALHGRPDFGFVAYGHDIVREGYLREDARQICVSTSFGCFDAAKTYLRLELDRRYDDTHALRPGHEILPLYPSGSTW